MRRVHPYENASVLLLCLLVAAGAAQCEAKGEEFTMRVGPAVSFAPTGVTFHVTVPRHKDNAAMVLGCTSEDGEQFSTYIQLEGASARYAYDRVFRSVQAGEYMCAAVVVDRNGKKRHGLNLPIQRIPKFNGPGLRV